ncbi:MULTISPECIES: hypothetical protein [Aerosakkonema]|uniref:hypothetical protein n=1 Tax=Aerosakkonema TaxID=1246629 RepID=UPI0035B93722
MTRSPPSLALRVPGDFTQPLSSVFYPVDILYLGSIDSPIASGVRESDRKLSSLSQFGNHLNFPLVLFIKKIGILKYIVLRIPKLFAKSDRDLEAYYLGFSLIYANLECPWT